MSNLNSSVQLKEQMDFSLLAGKSFIEAYTPVAIEQADYSPIWTEVNSFGKLKSVAQVKVINADGSSTMVDVSQPSGDIAEMYTLVKAECLEATSGDYPVTKGKIKYMFKEHGFNLA